MELHAQDRFVFKTQAFKRTVVQAQVSDFNFGCIEVAGRDAVIMILCGDENFTRWQMLNGMIPAVMSEREAVRIRAQRASDQLMT